MFIKKLFIAATLLVLATVLVAGCAGSPAKTVVMGDNVTVDYTGVLDDGTIFETSNATVAMQADIYDSNRTYAPITFKVGAQEVIPGFENSTIGMKVNETKAVTIQPDQAYGNYYPELIQPIPVSALAAGFNITDLHVNDTLYYRGQPVRVDSFPNNTTVNIDFNLPLAGKTLHFLITVRDIQP